MVEQDIKDRRLYSQKSRCAFGRKMNKIKSMAHAWSEQSMNTNAVLEGEADVQCKLTWFG